MLSDIAATAPTQRDRHLKCIAGKGRVAWQKASGYNSRSKVEAAIGRWKQVIGYGLHSHVQTHVRRLKSPSPSMSSTACRIWDARATSASVDPEWWGSL